MNDATGAARAPEQEQQQQPTILRTGLGVGLGIFLAIAGIVALVIGVAIYQIVSESVTEVRGGPRIVETLSACEIKDTSKMTFLKAGDVVTPVMVGGSRELVETASGTQCWMLKTNLRDR
jgi:hypothetical protein